VTSRLGMGKPLTFHYSVGEQIDEFIYVKNPPNCVGGIRVIIRVCVSVSLLTAPYGIHSSQCHCLSIISWSSTVREFPVPIRDVTTKLSLGGNNDVITELFLSRGSLVSDIPAGDGKLENLFYGVIQYASQVRIHLKHVTLLCGP
jgi:hypothetical protein